MIFLYFFGAFLAGVFTFLAPCSLPILPAYIAYVTKSEQKKITLNTLSFAAGLSFVFVLMGVFAGSIGRLLLEFKQEIVYVFGSIIIIFGLMSFFGKNLNLFNSAVKGQKGLLGSFGFGAIFAATWTGCIGPVLGIVLVLAASTQTVIYGALLLFVYGLGLLFPLILTSLYLDKLPENGRVWTFLRGKLFEFKFGRKTYYLHSTNIMSGVLFIFLGFFLIFEIKFGLTKLMPESITNWVFDIQDKITILMGEK